MPYYSDYDYDYEEARHDAMADAASEAREARLDQLREDYPDADEDELYDILMEEEADYCGCSDPCCPCDGFKRGVP